MKKLDLKPYLPHITAVFTFILVTFLYFSPLWNGKKINQHDNKTYLGMSKEVYDYRESSGGKEALWTNSMFGGMPAYQISVVKPENLLYYIDKYVFMMDLPAPASYAFLYMLGFFILLITLGVNPWLSIVGALAFAFSSYSFIIIEAGHNSKAHAIGYMAPTLALLIYTFKTRKYLVGGVFFSLFMALELYCNHPQISYYLMFILLAYGIGELWKAFVENQLPDFAKSACILGIGVVLALAVNTENYWTTAEYMPYTIRGKSELTFDKHIKSSGLDKDYATQWSYGLGETFTLMIPNAKGGASVAIKDYAPEATLELDPRFRENISQSGSYWGDQPMTSGPVYVGAVIFFLFILGLFIIEGYLKWSLLGVTIISIFLSWGHNWMWFSNLFFDYVPAYNKFRTVSMILVIVQLTTALIAILAVNKILKDPEIIKRKIKLFYFAIASTAGISILFYISPSSFFDFLSSAEHTQLLNQQLAHPEQASLYQLLFNDLEKARIYIFKEDCFRSFAFISIAAAFLFCFMKKLMSKNILIAALGLLILFDMVTVDRRFLNDKNYEKASTARIPYKETPADFQILQDKELDYRVFNTTVSTFNDASTSYYHKSIGGYHGAKLRRYQDLIEHHLSFGNIEVLNMLNTKYFIVQDNNGIPNAQLNTGRLGNAWFVKNIKWVANPDKEIMNLGEVLELKSLSTSTPISIYGRNLNPIDTILLTAPLNINSATSNKALTINLGRLNLAPGITYILGNDPNNKDSNFINLSQLEGGNLLANKQFEARIIYNFEPQNTAVIDQRFKKYFENKTINYSPTSSIILSEYKPNYLKYNTQTDVEQLAVFSEIYYDKGWDVYIDGKKSDYVRADYVLRAMLVPTGKHIIEFKFEPKSYYYGTKLTFIFSLSLLLSVIGVIAFKIRKMQKKL